MSYEFYKVLHILGILMVFTSLGGLAMHAANDLEKKANTFRVGASVTHGLGLLFILVAGFGLVARTGVGFPGWVVVKVGIWLILGAALAFVPKVRKLARVFWFAFPILGVCAALLAIYRPF